MLPSQHILPLKKLLEATHDSMQQLLRVLENEKTALHDNDIKGLKEMAQEKLALTEKIEKTEQQRHHFLTRAGLDPSHPQNWLNNPQLNTLWQQIKHNSTACQKCNQINGLVIHSNRRKIQTQLEILNAAVPSEELIYSASGERISQHTPNTIAQA